MSSGKIKLMLMTVANSVVLDVFFEQYIFNWKIKKYILKYKGNKLCEISG